MTDGPRDPREFLRQHVPQIFDEAGNPLSVLDQANSLAVEATLEQVRAVLILASSLTDKLELDAVLTTVSQRTKRRFKVATLRSIIKEIKSQGRTLAERPSWIANITVSSDGEPIPNAANVLTVLREADEWQGVVAFDEFHQRPALCRKPPWANGEWCGETQFTDADENRALVWMQRAGINCRIEAMRQALSIAIDDNRFHPVREYLDSLIWDGVARIDMWLTYYLGVEPIENYTGPIGARWLISGVARIYEPGCMAKYCLVLEGPQDLKKSTALEALGDPWFTDDIAELGTKDSQMQVGNAWIVELSELDSVRKADVSSIKAFISRKVDRFRKPFGRYVVQQPRQSILAGTVNPSTEYLTDDTGAVRFWPVLCKSIDIDALRLDRDQLWAEAITRYRQHEPWWLDVEEMQSAAYDEQDARTTVDPWTEAIANWLHDTSRKFVTTSTVMSELFDVPVKEHNRSMQTRIGSILSKRLGMVRRQTRKDGKPHYWYEYPSD